MKVRTTVRGGRLGANHNQTVLKVRTGLEAGRLGANHSEQLRVPFNVALEISRHVTPARALEHALRTAPLKIGPRPPDARGDER